MEKRRIFYKYTDFTTLQNIGYYWKSQILKWFPVSDTMTKVASWQVILWGLNIDFPIWTIAILYIIKYYVMQFVDWFYGFIAIRSNLYDAQQQYNAKQEHISPVQAETIATLKEICKKLEIKDKFTDL